MTKRLGDDVPDDPYERRDWLTIVIPNAMGYSADLAMAVNRYSEVTRVALDVTFGDATDDDLLAAAVTGLEDLRFMADCGPFRRKLKALIESIEAQAEAAPAEGDGADVASDALDQPVANDNQIDDGLPRIGKSRGASGDERDAAA